MTRDARHSELSRLAIRLGVGIGSFAVAASAAIHGHRRSRMLRSTTASSITSEVSLRRHTMAALFGSGRGGRSNSNLVEFKAGKMYLSGSMCHPDKRKGLLYAYRADDALVHVCWKDRCSATVQDDLIVFPDDAVFKRVPECTTGRVYVLLFKSSARKLIIWMQEPRADKDDENCRRLNEVLSGSIPEASASAGTALSDLANAGDLQTLLSSLNQQQLLRLLGGATGGLPGWPSVSVLGGSSRDSSPSPSSSASQRSGRHTGTAAATASSAQGQSRASSSSTGTAAAAASPTTASSAPAAVAAAAPAAGASVTAAARDESAAALPASAPAGAQNAGLAAVFSAERSQRESLPMSSDGGQQRLASRGNAASRISLGDLQQILSNIGTASGPQYSLADVLPADAVMTLVASDPAAMQKLVALLPSHGQDTWPPQGTAAAAELRSTLASPQFVQALTSFGSAFSSGQLAPVISQFDLPTPCQEAASQGDLEKFAKALQEHCATASNAKRKSDSEYS